MTLPRDYTLAEIDAMRELIPLKVIFETKGTSFYPSPEQVEDRLRTYMMAGVTLADLRGGVTKEPDMFGDEG